MSVVNVLFIEDDPDTVHLIREEFAQIHGDEKFELESADRLDTARKRIPSGGIDLILLDLALPDQNGLQTLVAILNQAPEIPVVVLTAWDDPALALEAVKRGAEDYLVKGGFDGKRLSQILRFAIERKRREQELLKKASDIEASKERLAETHRALIGEISRRQKAEEAQREERKKLDRMKDDFISTVSHELRTPITVIEMGVGNLRDGFLGPLTEKQAKVLDRNDRNVERLKKLIDNLLDLSRLESGRIKVNRRSVGFRSFIHEVVGNFQTGEREGDLSLKEEISTDLPELEMDPDLISQVLTNLLSNAVRYAHKEIIVKAEVMNGADDNSSLVRMSVINDGPGIPPDRIGELFNKFVQLDRKDGSNTYKGTGLGLAICKEIIDQHKGKIWVESDGEQGVAFHFTLPIGGGGGGRR